jgi:hypothetical protein
MDRLGFNRLRMIILAQDQPEVDPAKENPGQGWRSPDDYDGITLGDGETVGRIFATRKRRLKPTQTGLFRIRRGPPNRSTKRDSNDVH